MTRHDDSSGPAGSGESVTPGPEGPGKSAELPDAASASAEAEAAPELLVARDVLEQAVQKILDRDKQPRAAAVKSEMQKIISGKFDQSEYGYGSFRDFLADAAEMGAIVLLEPPSGDALITLPGREVPAAPAATRPRRRGRIREDVWRAFTSWEVGYTRLWDLESDQVLMFPTDPRPLEPQQHQVWRDLAKVEPGRFRVIDVIDEDQLTKKMYSFVQDLDTTDDAVPILSTALQQARPARSFTAAARALPGIAERWKQERFNFTWTWISKWQERNGVQSSIAGTPGRKNDRQSVQPTNPPMVRTGRSGQRPDEAPIDNAADAIRERIFAALARMPTSELLRLRVPVEYLLDQ